jgi:hypothetical protein
MAMSRRLTAVRPIRDTKGAEGIALHPRREPWVDSDYALSRRIASRLSPEEHDMKRLIAVTAMAVAFAPVSALAQERLGDAGLGAVSGAIVLGPIGAVGGAVIGYTAGPSIARTWGLRRSQSRHQGRSARRSTPAPSVQGSSAQAAATQGASGAAAAGAVRAAPVSPPQPAAQSAAVPTPMPPVQPLE